MTDGPEEGDELEPDVDDASKDGCPYCGATDVACEHLLLVADRTSSVAEGGFLYEAFEQRLSAMMDEAGDEADSVVLFEALLERAEELADIALEHEVDERPCYTCIRAVLYVETAERRMDALIAMLGL